jgi:hypothetical protein
MTPQKSHLGNNIVVAPYEGMEDDGSVEKAPKMPKALETATIKQVAEHASEELKVSVLAPVRSF